MLKKVVLGGLLSLSFAVAAEELTSFESITERLDLGKQLSVVVKDTLCEVRDPNEFKIPMSTMVLQPQVALFTEDKIAFDGVKYAHGRAPLPQAGLIQRGDIIMLKNNQVTTTVSFFDVETNKKIPQLKNVTITCQLGQGTRVFDNN